MTVEKQTWKILSKNFLFIPINTLQLFVHQPINFLGLLHELPRSKWLKPTKIFFHGVLDIACLKSACRRALSLPGLLGKYPPFLLPASD